MFVYFYSLGVLASDGFCRPLDNNASGYTRSEANGLIFLQKMKDAKRVYSSLIYTKTNCDGYKEQGVTYPSGEMQAKLLSEFYDDIKIDPASVSYIEAHSTGTLVGDPEECNALDKVFCKNRNKPLAVGSVKANIGHTEAAAGLCSIAKAILTYQNKSIPPNINFKTNREGIMALQEGRLKVVTDPTTLDGPLISINSFGFGGANAHALLKGYHVEKVKGGAPNDLIPRLVIWSGRTEESIHSILDDITARPMDADYVALLHNIQKEVTKLNIFRGFGIYGHKDGMNATNLCRELKLYSGLKRPVAWIFSGASPGLAQIGQLFVIPIFRITMENCHRILMSKGVNLIEIVITNGCIQDNLIFSFVGLTAVQIALVDVLRSLNIQSNYVIGHSIGEIACAYADGCLTIEQALHCAYFMGEISSKITSKTRAVVQIGMGYRRIRSVKPIGIELVCQNGPNSCIISGARSDLTAFIATLETQKSPLKVETVGNFVYHTSQSATLKFELMKEFQSIIPTPIKRSAKWRVQSNLTKYKYCSAEYFTNYFLRPILFEDVIATLSHKTMTIEIAPQENLTSSLSEGIPNGIHISLLEKHNKNNTISLLRGLGRLYNNGLTFDPSKLYPEIKFPVPAQTPIISPLIKWDHRENWFVTDTKNTTYAACFKIVTETIILKHEDYRYLEGHTIDGKYTHCKY